MFRAAPPQRQHHRNTTLHPLATPLALACAALVSACGGGGGGGGGIDLGLLAPAPAPAPPPPADPLTPAGPTDLDKAAALYGIEPGGVGGDAGGDGGAAGAAGDGSPLRRVTVTLTDAKGQQVRGTTDDNGKFLLKYQTASFAAPLVLRVIDAGGNILSSATEESAATGKVVRISVNPLTDKIVSDVVAGTVAGTDKSFDGSKIDVARVPNAKADLVTSVKAALGVAGIADTSKFDPVKSVYNYDGTGVDAVIESVSHTRDANTGATQLRAKLVPLQTNADGSVAPTLITAATPLATDAVAVASSPALTFGKITAWMNEVNRCLALSSAAREADANCDDADGTRLVSTSFKNNGKDLPETYRALYSESDLSAVQGSSLRNPLILFNTAAGGNTPYDSAVVEFTVNQPRTGPLSGSRTAPLQYTVTMVFRRDDNLKQAKAGNWILHGNQRTYDISVMPRYVQTLQTNPARQANSSGNSPSNLSTAITLNTALTRFDVATRSYVPTDIRAVRVKGPGLPTAGLVFSNSTTPGTTYLTIDNKAGQVSTGAMSNNNVGPNFTLSAVALDGSALYPGYWSSAQVTSADAPLSDFSSMQAFSRYTFEVFLNSNQSATPDVVEAARILAPIMPPGFSGSLQRHDFSPSLPLATAPAAGGCSFNVSWINNPNAAAVDGVFVYGANFNAIPAVRSIINTSVNATAVGERPTSVTSTAAGTGPSGCGSNAVPTLETNTFRQVGLGATQARYRIQTYLQWN